jgi:Na+/phosphate symporter
VKRFSSRFERIQHVRNQQERLARVNASMHNAEVSQAEVRTQQLQDQLQDSLTSIGDILHDQFTAAAFNGLQARRDCDETLVSKAEQLLDSARAAHKKSLADFEAARTDLRVVETLVANEREHHKREMRRAIEADAMERAARVYSDRIHETTGPLP